MDRNDKTIERAISIRQPWAELIFAVRRKPYIVLAKREFVSVFTSARALLLPTVLSEGGEQPWRQMQAGTR